MALNFQNLLADYNGAVFAQAGVVEWGYVPADWFLVLPDNNAAYAPNAIPDAPTPGVGLQNTNDGQNLAFIQANYHRCRQAAGSDVEAAWVAIMRWHCVNRGLLCKMAGRRIREDEYVVAGHLGANWGANENAVPGNAVCREIAKWVKRFGNAVLHAIAYAFVARGHHYKTEYKELYDRLMNVQGVDMKPSFQLPSAEIMYRLALHCIGIRPLVDLAIADRAAGIMSAPMMLRWQPHAPVAGVAYVTTLKATLNEMKKETWYSAIAAKFQQDIVDLDAEVALIAQNPYEYHVATSFITGAPRRYATQAGTKAFNRLAPFAIGYIDYVGKRHPLAGQKTITSHSGGGGGLSDNFSKACQTYSKGDFTAATMALWLNTV